MTAITLARPLSVVGVSGSTHSPSRTTALVDEILAVVARNRDVETHLVEVDRIGPGLAGTVRRSELAPSVEAELSRIETADLLVVASPVYRASYTGLFKHLFDFVEQYALVGTPVLLAATGGSERHGLMIEHQLRPLFGFFQSLTLPNGIYASDGDFTDYRISNAELRERIETAVARALPVVARVAPEVRSAYF
ncbi:FMN reductase [Microcella alkalica]|uniref:FMN reductase n=1 Tax=Microcella alkalica TaxID=355930 RepID=A0A839EFG3_9MICO|nr:FMN reductase [Microcella alkalica]MBA8848055.1 FMN reductase [Microcella alkalica]